MPPNSVTKVPTPRGPWSPAFQRQQPILKQPYYISNIILIYGWDNLRLKVQWFPEVVQLIIGESKIQPSKSISFLRHKRLPPCIRTKLSLSRLWPFEENLHTSNIWSEINENPGISGTNLNEQQEFHIPKFLSVTYSIKSLAAQRSLKQTSHEEAGGDVNSQSMVMGLRWGREREKFTDCCSPRKRTTDLKTSSVKMPASSGR